MNDSGKMGPNGGYANVNTARTNGCPKGFLNGGNDVKSPKWVRPRRSRAKLGPMLLVVCAAALMLASAFALSGAGGDGDPQPESGSVLRQPPPPPFNLIGYTYDAGGAILPGVLVTVTNKDKGESGQVVSDSSGWYEFNLNSLPSYYTAGDLINVTGELGGWIGYNETTTTMGGFMWMNIKVDRVFIPEFPMAIVPVVGMFALFAAVAVLRRKT